MKRQFTPGAFGLLLLSIASFCACDDTTTTTVYPLCEPVIAAIAPAESADSATPTPAAAEGTPTTEAETPAEGEDATPAPAAGDDTPAPLSTAGGSLTLLGRNIWPFFSGATPDTSCPESATSATPPADLSDGTPVPFLQTYDLEVLVGGERAEVTDAYEQSRPVLYQALDGTEVVSNCDTCLQCVTCNSAGCGGCEAACQGCVQVIDIVVPPLDSSAGYPSDSGAALSVPILVVSGIGETSEVYYDFTFACSDGMDNDDDGWIDLEDPGCGDQPTGTTELDACADGVDNDGDGQVDLEDAACAGDPRGQSEEATAAPAVCADGVDNDEDSWIDALDPDCLSGADEDESS